MFLSSTCLSPPLNQQTLSLLRLTPICQPVPQPAVWQVAVLSGRRPVRPLKLRAKKSFAEVSVASSCFLTASRSSLTARGPSLPKLPSTPRLTARDERRMAEVLHPQVDRWPQLH